MLAIRRSHVTNGSSLIEVDKFYLLTSRSGNIIEIGGRQRSGRNLRGIGHNGVWHDVGLHQGIGVVASSSGEGCTVGHLQFGVATQAQVATQRRLHLQADHFAVFPLQVCDFEATTRAEPLHFAIGPCFR